jgi:hypothetical protein
MSYINSATFERLFVIKSYLIKNMENPDEEIGQQVFNFETDMSFAKENGHKI